jgi:hypothetical protein
MVRTRGPVVETTRLLQNLATWCEPGGLVLVEPVPVPTATPLAKTEKKGKTEN